MTRLAHCVECGEPTNARSLICEGCVPLYETALMGDECACPSCNPPTDAAHGRVQALNRISEAQP